MGVLLDFIEVAQQGFAQVERGLVEVAVAAADGFADYFIEKALLPHPV